MGFTPCKAEKPQQGMDLQKKEEKKDEKHKRKFFRKNAKKKVHINLSLGYLDHKSNESIL